MMIERRDVEFEVEGGDRLRGWLFVPENRSARHPAISMAHGYAGVKEHGLERFTRAFTEAGFVVLVHDHGRHFDPNLGQFAAANTAAVSWFRQHLRQDQ
jgi:cephalosporin-C deacetylase-like acetyl esterase